MTQHREALSGFYWEPRDFPSHRDFQGNDALASDQNFREPTGSPCYFPERCSFFAQVGPIRGARRRGSRRAYEHHLSPDSSASSSIPCPPAAVTFCLLSGPRPCQPPLLEKEGELSKVNGPILRCQAGVRAAAEPSLASGGPGLKGPIDNIFGSSSLRQDALEPYRTFAKARGLHGREDACGQVVLCAPTASPPRLCRCWHGRSRQRPPLACHKRPC